MDENNEIFSDEVEKAYKAETESAINVSGKFKNDVVTKVKAEKVKNKKKTIITVVSAAAAFAVICGGVFVMLHFGLGANKSAPDSAAEGTDLNKVEEEDKEKSTFVPFEGLVGYGKVEDDLDNEENHSELNEEDRSYLKGSTYTDENVEKANWYKFFNSVVDATIDPRTDEALQYIEEKYNYFDSKGMEEEKKEAEAIIEAVDPYEGFPDEEPVETDAEKYPDLPNDVRLFILAVDRTGFKSSEGKVYNWFEFYNACLTGEIDPRYGLANNFVEDCLDYFTKSSFEPGKTQCELLLSAKNKGAE